jgi:glycosyltransferase involved in cell wall biosynthesis
MTVFNEESRIENLLKCLVWCDDIIVVEKSSTDRTRDIALRYTSKVMTVPYSDHGIEHKEAFQMVSHEWILSVTASDIIHPGLVDKMQALIVKDPFPYDIVAIPFVIMAFGVCDSHSPWFMPTKKLLFRKNAIEVRNEVHRENRFLSKRIYKMRPNDVEALYHLTMPTMDSYFSRIIRYCHVEPNKYPARGTGLWKVFCEIILASGWLIFKKRVFLLGWNGIALGLAFLVYYASKFLFVWEKFRPPSEYGEVQKGILMEWEKRRRTQPPCREDSASR